MSKVFVIGDGGWGTALALLMHSQGNDTVLWSAFPEYAEYLRKNRENTKFLEGVPLPEDLEITSDAEAAEKAEYVFFVVPSKYLRPVVEKFRNVKAPYIISAIKGIENGSLKRPSEVLREYFPESHISVLSGPSISYEVARSFPTTVVVASQEESRFDIQKLLTTECFRVYTLTDTIGAELGGALKNIIAIAAGISDGLGFGTNSKAALLTRGLAEIIRLGVKMGAEKETFSGLSGIGDLTTTCISLHSRNRWFGEQIGKGRNIKDVLHETEMVVEGLATCKAAYELSKKYEVVMPITEKIYEVVHEGKDPKVAVKELMTRDLKDENFNY
ncbi:MAG: NAD(P)H-dependent glycerol-3-phosphate dehydrogenase [Candidatus Omnitrophota bacterium]